MDPAMRYQEIQEFATSLRHCDPEFDPGLCKEAAMGLIQRWIAFHNLSQIVGKEFKNPEQICKAFF